MKEFVVNTVMAFGLICVGLVVLGWFNGHSASETFSTVGGDLENVAEHVHRVAYKGGLVNTLPEANDMEDLLRNLEASVNRD